MMILVILEESNPSVQDQFKYLVFVYWSMFAGMTSQTIAMMICFLLLAQWIMWIKLDCDIVSFCPLTREDEAPLLLLIN